MTPPLLRATGVRVRYSPASPPAVDGVDLELTAGETLGIVGSSGSGKSTLVRALLGLLPFQGTIEWEGTPVAEWLRRRRVEFRSRVQLLLQNPLLAFDPRQRIGDGIGDVLRLHRRSVAGVPELLSRVGLDPEFQHRLPGRLSGGELQRVSLARALAVEPEVLVLDEALVSLDPVSRSEIVDLLRDLQRSSSLTYVYVAHDLGMVAAVADRIGVMHAGRIVQIGETSEVLTGSPEQETRRLRDASPVWKGAESGGTAGV